jgi:hypothetical protein
MLQASVCNNLGCSKDCAYLKDIKRFTLYFQECIVQDPLQIYCSTSLFTPAASPVRMQVGNSVPRWMQKLPKVDKDWRSPLALTHGSRVVAVGFVPGGNRLVVAIDSCPPQTMEPSGCGTFTREEDLVREGLHQGSTQQNSLGIVNCLLQ